MEFILSFFSKYPFFAIFISLLLGYYFMPIVIQIARKYNFVVSPNKRTSHLGEVPNIGGINIFFSFLLTVLLISSPHMLIDAQFTLIGLFVVLIVGFIDDLVAIKVSWKLVGELIAGFFLVVIADVRLVSLHGFFGIYELNIVVSYLLSMFIFIVIINAMNLVDGIDGLATGLGILYSLFFGIYFYLVGEVFLSIVAFALIGSLVVFFFFNVFSKGRKIFMGDSGSLLLGYVLNVFVFSFCKINGEALIPEKYVMSAAPEVAFTVLILPLFDTIRVMITRIKKGYSPFKADRNHIHHLLLGFNWKHRNVTFFLLSISFLFILFAIIGRNFPTGLLISTTLILSTILTFILWHFVNKRLYNTPKSQ